MKTTLVDIKALLVTKIQSIKVGAVSVFGQVTDYAAGDFTNYPAVVVRPSGGTGEYIDTARNERTFAFTVDLFQEQSEVGKTKEEASDILESVVDKLLIAFDQDKTLGNEVQTVEVVEMRFDFDNRKGTYNFASFDINCVVVVNNYLNEIGLVKAGATVETKDKINNPNFELIVAKPENTGDKDVETLKAENNNK